MQNIQENNNGIISVLDNNFFSTSPSLENSCCRYSSDVYSENVECSSTYKYDAVWWNAPLGFGIILLLYFPLLFLEVIRLLYTKPDESSNKDCLDKQINSTAQTDLEDSNAHAIR